MSTRSGIKFNNPPVSDRELRRRKRAADVAAEAAAEAAAIEAAEAAAKALQATKKKAIPGHKKKQKKKKKQNKSPFSHQTPVKTFPFGIESSLVDSFNDFYEIHCRIDSANVPTDAPNVLSVGDVHKQYKAWCNANNRDYCPTRTSPRWEVGPFVVNKVSKERLPPFRLLMFHKLGRLPQRINAVFSKTSTSWRRHSKNRKGFPYYKGLAWKASFTAPKLKYTHR